MVRWMRRFVYAMLGVAFLLTLSGVLAVTDGDSPRVTSPPSVVQEPASTFKAPAPIARPTRKAPPPPKQGRGSRAGCGVTIGCTALLLVRGGRAG